MRAVGPVSARVTGMVFDRYPGSGGELLLALALADHSHDDGTRIFPSTAYLAKKTRQSERSVQYQQSARSSTSCAGWKPPVGCCWCTLDWAVVGGEATTLG